MLKLIKYLFILALLAFLGLVAFAYLGDLPPDQTLQTRSLTLDVE